MMIEKWKDIPYYDGIYQISNKGRVKSIRKNTLIKLQKYSSGHLFVMLYKDGKRQSFMVSRLVAQSFIGEISYKRIINKDGNINNNNADNLQIATYSSIMNRVIKQRKRNSAKGERIPQSRLKEHDVIKAISLLNQGEKCIDISKTMGVSKSAISQIKTFRTWKHIKR